MVRPDTGANWPIPADGPTAAVDLGWRHTALDAILVFDTTIRTLIPS